MNLPPWLSEKEYCRSSLFARTPLNLPSSIKCYEKRPCKRIASCDPCRLRRRDFFVAQGMPFLDKNKITHFVTVRWEESEPYKAWETVLREYPLIWKKMTRLFPRYVRCLAIGELDTPHVHFLLEARLVQPLSAMAFSSDSFRGFHEDEIHDQAGVLGYLYDQNFYETFIRPDRPKRIRLLSGSRGMKYGFPDGRENLKEDRDVRQ